MKMFLIAASLAALIVLGIAAILVIGTAGPPPVLASLINPLDKIDFSDLPAIETIPARKGGTIAFRRWGVANSACYPYPHPRLGTIEIQDHNWIELCSRRGACGQGEASATKHG